jgi:uncharacterized membrane protein
MKSPIALFTIVTAITFLIGDMFIIPLIMRPMFSAALGDSMLETLRLGPAAAFYIIQVAGIAWFAGLPFLRDGNLMKAGVNGAVLGFIAYSCYEFTSWTIMRDWHVGLVIADLAWGTAISGLAAYAGAFATSKRLPARQT